MLERYQYVLLLLMVSGVLLAGNTHDKDVFAVAATSSGATVLARADVALARSIISPTAYRGSLGEAVAGTSFLKDSLRRTGNWQSISPRSGPQGFDHVFIKTTANGIPVDLLVGESKFNSSRLGMTKDGIQMGVRWTGRRLAALGGRYLAVAAEPSIASAKMPLLPNRQISVVLPNGQSRFFWKNSATDTWKFSGRPEELPVARKLAGEYGKILKNAGMGHQSFRSRVFNIVPVGNDLKIDIYDAGNVDRITSLTQLKKLSSMTLNNALAKNTLPSGVCEDIAIRLKSKLALSDAEARKMAAQIQRRYFPRELMTSSGWARSVAVNAASAALIPVAIELIGMGVTGELQFDRLALAGGSSFAGVAAGQFVHGGLLLPTARNALQSISGPLCCSTSMLSSAIASTVGGGVATALFSYGLYFLGYSDLKNANRNMIVGSSSVVAGTLFSTGVMMGLATWGTASTGTAIASLSGAAATNASLALLGGSVAVGGTILTLGAILIAGGVAYVGQKLFQMHDEREETQRISAMIEYYSRDSIMEAIVNRSPFVRNL